MSSPVTFLAVVHCLRTLSLVAFDLVVLVALAARPRAVLVAENLFLRKQLTLFQERQVRPRRADASTRWMMAALSQWFAWRNALVNVQADALLRWHRQGFRLFWRWKSKTAGRPRLPNNLQALIREMAAENTTWGQERIANELQLKLGIRVSPARSRSTCAGAAPCARPTPSSAGAPSSIIMPRRSWPATSSSSSRPRFAPSTSSCRWKWEPAAFSITT